MNLENVKVGDTLVVHARYNEYLETVERVTTTLAITRHNRFSKKTGYSQGGDSWSRVWATVATETDIERITKAQHRRKLIDKCEGTYFKNLSDEQLEKIVSIIDCPCREKGGSNATD